MANRRVLSVGQCGADHSKIVRTLQAFDVEIVPADTTEEALMKLKESQFTVVLVNRVYDIDGSPGMDLIRRIKGDEMLRSVPVMLVSNHDDAQQEAVAAGAVPGFGKAALYGPLVVERLRPFLSGD
jgi:two-component system, chemotaxis family, chemotaxis protein CheY